MPEHTQGPWINRHFNSSGQIEIGSANYRTASVHDPMVRVYPRLDWSEEKGLHHSESAIEQAEANARLIAASPEMLSVLRLCDDILLRVERAIERCNPGDEDTRGLVRSALIEVTAVISKAVSD